MLELYLYNDADLNLYLNRLDKRRELLMYEFMREYKSRRDSSDKWRRISLTISMVNDMHEWAINRLSPQCSLRRFVTFAKNKAYKTKFNGNYTLMIPEPFGLDLHFKEMRAPAMLRVAIFHWTDTGYRFVKIVC